MQDIKILKDATQSWLEVAESPAVNGELYIMTPYFTGSIISKLVKAAHEKSIYFFTDLSGSSVLSQSVDLNVIEELLDAGVVVYSRSNLHAKLIYNGNSVVIGSQNFTRKGITNLEVSAAFSARLIDKETLNLVIREATLWSTLITKKHIKFLKSWYEENLQEFAELDKKFNIVNDFLTENSNHNLYEKNKSPQKLRSDGLECRIKKVKYNTSQGQSEYTTVSVISKDKNFEDILKNFTGTRFFKRDGKGLLILNEETMETVYAEVHQRQISKFFDQWCKGFIECEDEYEDGEINFIITCASPAKTNRYVNLIISLEEPLNAKIYTLFNGTELVYKGETIRSSNPILKRRAENEIKLIRKYLTTKTLHSVLNPQYSFSFEFNDAVNRKYPQMYFDTRKMYTFKAASPIEDGVFLSANIIDT